MNTSPTSKKRSWLFRKSRPEVRPFEAKDRGFLWAAHLAGVFGLPADMSQEAFLAEMAQMFGAYQFIWVLEDDSTKFRAGRGPVAIVGIRTDGWTMEPAPMWFPWVTKRNVLRACVAFLQMIRYQKDVGVCLIRAGKAQSGALNHMARYGVLYQRGRIPHGSAAGDVYVYSINGKKAPVASVERMAA